MNCMMTYITGPHISNAILGTYCSTAHFRLEAAQQKCTEDSTCLFIHDYNCDGWGWRYCSGDVHQIQSLDPSTQACMKVKFAPCTTVTVTDTSAETTVANTGTPITSLTTMTSTETSITFFTTMTSLETTITTFTTMDSTVCSYIPGPRVCNAAYWPQNC